MKNPLTFQSGSSLPPLSPLFLILLVLLASLLATSQQLPAQGIRSFKFEIETLGGQKLTQDHFKDNVLILDFWYTTCPPCRRSIPGLVDLYRKYKHHGLEIIGLNYKEEGSKTEATKTIREFAKKNGITYTLALGTSKIRNQVIGFSAYPTMLFFKKGMVYDHLEVGFTDEHLRKMEEWVRAELGLSGAGGKKPDKAGDKPEGKPEEEEEEEEVVEEEEEEKPAKVTIPEGVIYRPGNHDKGFDFVEKNLEGKNIRFADFRGKPVILALTSTWDPEAKKTMATLNKLYDQHSKDGVAVLAASLELKRDLNDKIDAIQRFIAEHKPCYTIFPVGIKFQKKIHMPSGLPLFLVFNKQGTLILRQKSASLDVKAIGEAVEQAQK